MKKVLSLALALLLLLSFGACADGSDGSSDGVVTVIPDESPSEDHPSAPASEADPAIRTGTPVGFSSEEELVNEFIACYNKGEVSDRFLNAFDSNANVAYWLFDDSFAHDMTEAYGVYADRSKGADFIRTAYPAFAGAWSDNIAEEMTNEALRLYFVRYQAMLLASYCPSLTDRIRREWNENAAAQEMDEEEYLVTRCRALEELLFPEREQLNESTFAKWKSAFGGTDVQFRAENSWRSDYGYMRYTVDVEDPEHGIQSISVVYLYRDGSYYWCMLHMTA